MQPGHHGACFCGCQGAMQSAPRFVSKDRRISELKQHLADLKDEAKAIEEHIAQIRKEK
jgi:hypothetical protein